MDEWTRVRRFLRFGRRRADDLSRGTVDVEHRAGRGHRICHPPLDGRVRGRRHRACVPPGVAGDEPPHLLDGHHHHGGDPADVLTARSAEPRLERAVDRDARGPVDDRSRGVHDRAAHPADVGDVRRPRRTDHPDPGAARRVHQRAAGLRAAPPGRHHQRDQRHRAHAGGARAGAVSIPRAGDPRRTAAHRSGRRVDLAVRRPGPSAGPAGHQPVRRTCVGRTDALVQQSGAPSTVGVDPTRGHHDGPTQRRAPGRGPAPGGAAAALPPGSAHLGVEPAGVPAGLDGPAATTGRRSERPALDAHHRHRPLQVDQRPVRPRHRRHDVGLARGGPPGCVALRGPARPDRR